MGLSGGGTLENNSEAVMTKEFFAGKAFFLIRAYKKLNIKKCYYRPQKHAVLETGCLKIKNRKEIRCFASIKHHTKMICGIQM